ncbi:Na(+)-translocating NADH-quinone reductase subunit C [Gammaproteobacteria bacterium]|jgi:Na+-transporting NADH:ubiquinone oxidoreductase subunit C|nr:Na(+)-translocating NADH-quinone reductase subunit C [Gammaproteobacteria bacterium]MDG1229960.1 Na(+)-translocating NADH-quinone reductase subunit C [SAR86 cluster bacterium]
MNNNDTIKKTLIVAVSLCLVCSALISFSAVELRDLQEANKTLDKQNKILSAAGLLKEGSDVSELFKSIDSKIVNLETGKFDFDINVLDYDEGSFSRNPETSIELSSDKDIALLKRRENFQTVYLHYENEDLNAIILPVRGYGLWGTMKGYLALRPDFKTIIGLEFFDHKETPGLGGEIDNPKWKAIWKGKEVFSNSGEVVISVIKGSVDKSSNQSKYQVDGLSGATITSNGVTNLLSFWLGDMGYGPLIENIKSSETKDV